MSSTSFPSFLSSSSAASGKGSASRGLGDRIAERTGSGVPKFKSLPPPSLPISTPAGAASPSSWFAIPPGLSPAELLDSPILLSSSSIFPSPTTGTFPILGFDWKTNSDRDLKNDYKINFPEFSFQTQEKPLPSYSSTGDQTWGSSYTFDDQNNNSNNQIPPKQDDTRQSSDRSNDLNSSSQSFSPEIAAIQTTNTANKRSDDGYNWRKYGQKQVKGSENPRSYYKCTYPNCPTKKKVERSLEGRITEIVYKGTHNHPKPQSTRRSSTSSSSASAASSVINHQPQSFSEIPDQSSYGNNDNSVGKMEFLAMTPENNSSISVGDEEFEQSSQKTADEIDEDEHNAKRWKGETETEGISAAGNRAVREPRVVVQTTSDIDILDDGYRWRKYGQKVVKGNPNPRSYYKCTTPGCPVRKHVERASHDPRAVITTYEGKHNHDVPAARGSGSHAISRPMPSNPGANNGPAMTILPHQHDPNYPMRHSQAPGAAEPRAPNTLEMLSSSGGFGYPGFGNSCTMYPSGNENVLFGRTKDEPRDDMFLESLPC